MKRPAIIIGFIITVIIGLTIAQAVVANRISTTGIQLDKIQTEIAAYKKENTLLHEKILTLSSLTHIASEASTLGFVPSTTHLYLSTPLPIALNK